MKTKNLVFILSCALIIVILGFSIYKSYFLNSVSVDNFTTADSDSEITTELITESEIYTEPESTTEIITTATINTADDDFSCFDNVVFIGNSRFVSFKNYGLCKNVYAVVGLTVDTIFTKSASGSNVAIIDELYGKSYDKIVLMMGDNECGWPNLDIFIERYEKVIDAIKARAPGSEIYIHAVLPVSAEASAKNNYGCNNNAINSLNAKVKQLCAEEGIIFIDQPSCLKASDGSLLPEAASDGIHLSKSYAEIWLNSLKKVLC